MGTLGLKRNVSLAQWDQMVEHKQVKRYLAKQMIDAMDNTQLDQFINVKSISPRDIGEIKHKLKGLLRQNQRLVLESDLAQARRNKANNEVTVYCTIDIKL